MNQKVVLWIVGLAVVVIAGAALYYAMNLAGQPLYQPTTPSTPPATAGEFDDLEQVDSQFTTEAAAMDAELKEYDAADPSMDTLEF